MLKFTKYHSKKKDKDYPCLIYEDGVGRESILTFDLQTLQRVTGLSYHDLIRSDDFIIE